MESLDADGFLTLKDCSKDVIASVGFNICPREVEDVLLLHPQIRKVAVGAAGCGVERGKAGRWRVRCWMRCAWSTLRASSGPRCIDALPRNSYGKVLKMELGGGNS